MQSKTFSVDLFIQIAVGKCQSKSLKVVKQVALDNLSVLIYSFSLCGKKRNCWRTFHFFLLTESPEMVTYFGTKFSLPDDQIADL